MIASYHHHTLLKLYTFTLWATPTAGDSDVQLTIDWLLSGSAMIVSSYGIILYVYIYLCMQTCNAPLEYVAYLHCKVVFMCM